MSTDAKTDSNPATPEGSPGPQRKKFHNGWTKELETLFADWADKAACYRWMHERTSRIFGQKDQSLMFPIIILSTVTGAANFALDSVLTDPTIKKYAQLGLGGMSILTGILTTIANRLGYSSGCESHRVASISWGKFNRFICIELSLHPNERMESFSFMKMFRTELDRLIEQSPSIPETVIRDFIHEFKSLKDIKKPDITGELEHTKIFAASDERLKRIAQEAALTLSHRKGVIKQLVMDELDKKVRAIAKESAKQFMAEQKAAVAAVAAASKPNQPKTIAEKQKVEREAELKSLAQSNVVAQLKNRFAQGVVVPPDSSDSPVSPIGLHSTGSSASMVSRGRTMERRSTSVAGSPRPSIAGSVAGSVGSVTSQALSVTRAPPANEFVINFDSMPPPPLLQNATGPTGPLDAIQDTTNEPGTESEHEEV